MRKEIRKKSPKRRILEKLKKRMREKNLKQETK